MVLLDDMSKPAHFEDLNKSEIDRLEDYCRPLQDDETLIRRINGESRHLRAFPEIRQVIADAISKDDDKSIVGAADYIKMALDIYNLERSRPSTPAAALLDHLNLCGELFNNVVEADNFLEAEARVGDLAYTISANQVLKIPEQELTGYSYVAKYLAKRLDSNKIIEKLKPYELAHGYYGIIEFLNVFIDNRNHLVNYLDDMPKDETLEIISDSQVEVDNLEIQSMFEQAMQNRCYGVKNGYKSQKNREGIFVFADLEKIKTNLPRFSNLELEEKHMQFEKGLAYVLDLPQPSYSKNVGNFLKRVSSPQSADNKQMPSFNIRDELSIQKDGRLVSTFDVVSIEHLARDKGCYKTYRNVQAEILANFIDLVTPIENSNLANEIEKRDAKKFKKSDNAGADIVRKLLIPRIKAAQIRNNSSENEYISGEEDSSESRREVKLHSVVWHIRQLPEGWHASPNAQAMAADAGITLKNGETFVKPHSRGVKKMGEVAVHEFVCRPE